MSKILTKPIAKVSERGTNDKSAQEIVNWKQTSIWLKSDPLIRSHRSLHKNLRKLHSGSSTDDLMKIFIKTLLSNRKQPPFLSLALEPTIVIIRGIWVRFWYFKTELNYSGKCTNILWLFQKALLAPFETENHKNQPMHNVLWLLKFDDLHYNIKSSKLLSGSWLLIWMGWRTFCFLASGGSDDVSSGMRIQGLYTD